MIPYYARFYIGVNPTRGQEEALFAIARRSENDLLYVRRTELADEQGYLGGVFIDFVSRRGRSDARSEDAMLAIYQDKALLEELNAVDGVSVVPIGYG